MENLLKVNIAGFSNGTWLAGYGTAWFLGTHPFSLDQQLEAISVDVDNFDLLI